MTSLLSVVLVTGTTITGVDNSDTIAFVGGQNTVVFGSTIGTAAQVSFGTGNDMATFNSAISAGSIYGGTGSDTLAFAGAVTEGATIDQGAGADSVISVQASRVQLSLATDKTLSTCRVKRLLSSVPCNYWIASQFRC